VNPSAVYAAAPPVTEINRPVAILRTALRGLVVRKFIGRLLELGGSGLR
jgi:hypothetical protein